LFDNLEEKFRVSFDVLVHFQNTLVIDNADAHFSCMQVDTTKVLVLFADKFHIGSLSFRFEKIWGSLLLPYTIPLVAIKILAKNRGILEYQD
jgi:hypothetical protein